jgi:hypothetical protein
LRPPRKTYPCESLSPLGRYKRAREFPFFASGLSPSRLGEALEKEGPVERAGEQIDEAIEKAGDKLEKAADR